MPPQITRAVVLLHYTCENGITYTKIAFFSRCISTLPEFNQLLVDFFNLFDSRLILALLYDFLNLVINAFSLELWKHGSGERKSTSLQQLDCVARTKHQCAVFWVSSFATYMLKH